MVLLCIPHSRQEQKDKKQLIPAASGVEPDNLYNASSSDYDDTAHEHGNDASASWPSQYHDVSIQQPNIYDPYVNFDDDEKNNANDDKNTPLTKKRLLVLNDMIQQNNPLKVMHSKYLKDDTAFGAAATSTRESCDDSNTRIQENDNNDLTLCFIEMLSVIMKDPIAWENLQTSMRGTTELRPDGGGVGGSGVVYGGMTHMTLQHHLVPLVKQHFRETMERNPYAVTTMLSSDDDDLMIGTNTTANKTTICGGRNRLASDETTGTAETEASGSTGQSDSHDSDNDDDSWEDVGYADDHSDFFMGSKCHRNGSLQPISYKDIDLLQHQRAVMIPSSSSSSCWNTDIYSDTSILQYQRPELMMTNPFHDNVEGTSDNDDDDNDNAFLMGGQKGQGLF